MTGHSLKAASFTCECGFTTTDIKMWLDHVNPGLSSAILKATKKLGRKVAED